MDAFILRLQCVSFFLLISPSEFAKDCYLFKIMKRRNKIFSSRININISIRHRFSRYIIYLIRQTSQLFITLSYYIFICQINSTSIHFRLYKRITLAKSFFFIKYIIELVNVATRLHSR